MLARFEADIEMMLAHLDATNFDAAVALARLPGTIKGFGPVKEDAAESALERRNLYLSLTRSQRNYPDWEPNCSARCDRLSEAGSFCLSRLSPARPVQRRRASHPLPGIPRTSQRIYSRVNASDHGLHCARLSSSVTERTRNS